MPIFNYIHRQIVPQKNYGNASIYALHKGAHEPETAKAWGHIIDGVIETKKTEEKRDSKSAQGQKLRKMQYSTKQY